MGFPTSIPVSYTHLDVYKRQQYDKKADYNASVVITYTDGTVDDQLEAGKIKGGNAACRPTANLNTACSASSQNTTNLSYDMTISSLYPTPLYLSLIHIFGYFPNNFDYKIKYLI